MPFLVRTMPLSDLATTVPGQLMYETKSYGIGCWKHDSTGPRNKLGFDIMSEVLRGPLMNEMNKWSYFIKDTTWHKNKEAQMSYTYSQLRAKCILHIYVYIHVYMYKYC